MGTPVPKPPPRSSYRHPSPASRPAIRRSGCCVRVASMIEIKDAKTTIIDALKWRRNECLLFLTLTEPVSEESIRLLEIVQEIDKWYHRLGYLFPPSALAPTPCGYVG